MTLQVKEGYNKQGAGSKMQTVKIHCVWVRRHIMGKLFSFAAVMKIFVMGISVYALRQQDQQ